MTISLPDPMKEWIEAQIREGDYASTSDYVRDLVRRDRQRREQERELTIEDLRKRIADTRAGGMSKRSVDEIFEEAKALAAARRLADGQV